MKTSFKYTFWILLVLFGIQSQAQILDDSTKEIYSSRTVKYRLENQLVTNYGAQSSDTSLRNFSEKGDFLYQSDGWYQNLGVFGTAARSLYYQLPAAIGLRNGQTSFDYIVPSKDEVKYYNTLSPHSDIQYFQGARQRAMLRATFSQNILPRLNITGHYQRLTAMRTINITQSEERQSDHHSAYVSSNFSDSLGRYRAWGHYQHLNHLEYETGGALFANDTKNQEDSLFENPEIFKAQLNQNARNRELRNNWYFSQIWKPSQTGIYLRTSHYRFRQTNRYTDPAPNLAFYGKDNLYFQKPITTDNQPIDTLFSERIFRLWENTGFIGYQDSSIDVSFYLRHRDIRYSNNLFSYFTHQQDWVYGGQFSGRLGPGKVWLKGEWIGPTEYDLQSEWNWAGFQATARWMSFRPSVVQQEFISKNLFYLNDFSNSKALHLHVSQKIKLGKWAIIPEFDHQSVLQGIAFGSNYEPFQASGTSTMQRFKIQVRGQLGNIFFTENQLIRVFQSGARISQMPTYAFHSAHWVELLRNRKGYRIQLGFNLDWRADWTSESYSPLNGQWYLTNNQTVAPYTLVDVFAHFQLAKTRIYGKVHNTLQGLGSKGYFAAPNYQAQRRLFEIGLIWYFFD